MNKVILMGRLTRDAETRYSQSPAGDNAVTHFSVAVDRRRSGADGQREADFISCVAFGKTAEFVQKYFSKGSKIVITGRIQTGSYTNKEGVKVYTTDVVAEEVEFAESKSASQNSSQGAPAAANGGYYRPQYGNPGAYQPTQGAPQYQAGQQQMMPTQGQYQAPPQGYNDGFMPVDSLESEELPFG